MLFVIIVEKPAISEQIVQNMMAKISDLLRTFLAEDDQVLIKPESVTKRMMDQRRPRKKVQVPVYGQPQQIVPNDGAKAVMGPTAWQVLKGPSLSNRLCPFLPKVIGM